MASKLEIGHPVCVADVGDLCGEGAVWHPEQTALYWADINGFRIHRLGSLGKITTWPFDEPVTALTLTAREDTLVVVLATRILLWEPGFDRRTEFYQLPDAPAVRCNDARVDPAGVLWVATMQNNVTPEGGATPVERSIGSLFSVTRSGLARTWRTEVGIGNTLAWSPDGQSLYTADTPANKIFRLQWHPDSTVSDEELWFAGDPRGKPDGSTVDADGFLWNCRYGGGVILRIAPSGTLDRAIELPVANPTTCVFGGVDGSTLYVTSAALADPEHQQAGGLFAIETNMRGLAENRFQL